MTIFAQANLFFPSSCVLFLVEDMDLSCSGEVHSDKNLAMPSVLTTPIPLFSFGQRIRAGRSLDRHIRVRSRKGLAHPRRDFATGKGKTMADKLLTVFRAKKLKSREMIAGSTAHMMRWRHAANADPDRTSLNRIIIGSSNPLAEVDALLEGAWARAGSVLAIEVVISASHEWWEAATPEQANQWVRANVKFLREAFGDGNVAHLQLHMDERTPHLTGFIIPLVNGRLNAKAFLGGRQKLRELQDKAAAAVSHLGIERGVKGSQATHQPLKKFYAALDGDVETPDPEILPMIVSLAKASNQNANAAKEATARLRAIDPRDVLRAAGLEPSKRDKARWVDDEERFAITVTGAKWYDHRAGTGKGGAIDLVQHLLGCDFATARSWLASRFDAAQVVADQVAQVESNAKAELAVSKPVEFVPPQPSPEHWPTVKKYLVETRALPVNWVEASYANGNIYADGRANAVFIARDGRGKPVGAELRGTDPTRPFKGHALGSRRDRGVFSVGNPAASIVVVVESAIDAMSYAVLKVYSGIKDVLKNTLIVSTGGVRDKPPAGTENKRLLCAYDNDNAGNAAGTWGERLRPVGCKDWNEQLQDIVSFRRNPEKARIAAEAELAALEAANETLLSSFPEAEPDDAGGVGVALAEVSPVHEDMDKPEANGPLAP